LFIMIIKQDIQLILNIFIGNDLCILVAL